MFGWFRKQRPDNRYVFHYHDGVRKRSADPLEVERSLIASLGEDWRTQLRELEAPVPLGTIGVDAAVERERRLAKFQAFLTAIDAAFGVRAYTDHAGTKTAEGLTELARFGLLKGFMQFCGALVELARPFATAQSRASPPLENPPIASDLDSSSIVEPSPMGVPSI